ncbi:MAG: D-tyrosyl-tRNA(Tyr) deacylase [Cytophagales bacterium]|nr:D-tyrosyl-tRNA(Tyr) deacylase [Cytophagales bacterium]
MRVVVQRVSEASVTIEGVCKSAIQQGLLVLVGFEETDTQEDLNWLANKIINQRIFADHEGKMNKSVKDVGGELLLVSQFTLFASTKKGNRPSFIRSAKPDVAIPLYEQFIKLLSELLGEEIKTGEFGANMQVRLLNDGPITITMDSKNKE